MPPSSTSEHTLISILTEEDMEPEITTTADDLNEGYHLGGLSHWLHGTPSAR